MRMIFRSALFDVGLAGAVLILNFATSYGQGNADGAMVAKEYNAEVSIYSIDPEKGIGSYRAGNGSGSFGSMASCGLGISRGEQHLEMQIACEKKADRFLA